MAEAAISLLEENALLRGQIEQLEETSKEPTILPQAKPTSYSDILLRGPHNPSCSTLPETAAQHLVPSQQGLLKPSDTELHENS